MATSELYSDSFHVVYHAWTLDQLLDAHIVLDAYHRAHVRAERKS